MWHTVSDIGHADVLIGRRCSEPCQRHRLTLLIGITQTSTKARSDCSFRIKSRVLFEQFQHRCNIFLNIIRVLVKAIQSKVKGSSGIFFTVYQLTAKEQYAMFNVQLSCNVLNYDNTTKEWLSALFTTE